MFPANRLRKPYSKTASKSVLRLKFCLKIVEKRHAGSGLSRLPLAGNCKTEFEMAGTWLQRPRVISIMNAALFVGQSAANMRLPPCIKILWWQEIETWDDLSAKKGTYSRSFTSVQMFHTHAPLPRGLFGRQHHEVSGCSDTFPEAGLWQIRRPRPTARGSASGKRGCGQQEKRVLGSFPKSRQEMQQQVQQQQ